MKPPYEQGDQENPTQSAWVRIPDGIRVKHKYEGLEGFIDGLTECAVGPDRNSDGRTQLPNECWDRNSPTRRRGRLSILIVTKTS